MPSFLASTSARHDSSRRARSDMALCMSTRSTWEKPKFESDEVTASRVRS